MCGIISSETISGIFGVIFGGVITFVVEWLIKRSEAKKELSHSASLLLNDLKSIATYCKKMQEGRFPETSIRYSHEWQHMVSKCTFLGDAYTSLLYEMYDEIYDYNQIHAKIDVPYENIELKRILSKLSTLVLVLKDKTGLFNTLEKYCNSINRSPHPQITPPS
ncbi:MAG: hypothetical protein FWG87_08845 [Defluviitaleaceae bacterium]|nr:hypothetical protein [Defluviitaleaceae bacterium]